MAKLVWYNTTRIRKLQAINPRHAECLSLLVIPWTTLEFFLGSMKRRQPCHWFWELVTVIRSFRGIWHTRNNLPLNIFRGYPSTPTIQPCPHARFFFEQRRGLRFDLETLGPRDGTFVVLVISVKYFVLLVLFVNYVICHSVTLCYMLCCYPRRVLLGNWLRTLHYWFYLLTT